VLTFAEPAVQRVRQCSADNCLIVYLDTSRPGRRRWCAMQRCGNRHKVAEHRARSRGPSGAEGQ
jgi:predicted RNA-binding Zn ribbon-like protein